jgi:hypothetical protein
MPEQTKQPETTPQTETTKVVGVDLAAEGTDQTVTLQVTQSDDVGDQQQESVLEDWQQRMLDESAQLDDRIQKATTYVLTLDRDSVDYRQLQHQIQAMREYRQALGIRIARLVP